MSNAFHTHGLVALILASTIWIQGGCATAQPLPEQQDEGGNTCIADAADLAVSDGDPASASRTINILPGHHSDFELFRVRLFVGPCAPMVVDAMPGQLKLAGGYYYEVRDGLVSPRNDASILFDVKGAENMVPPEFNGQSFVDAAYYSGLRTDDGLVRDYVAIWQTGAKWTVASFTAAPDGTTTKPVPLLTSTLPIKGVAFFPAPDTASGTLSIVQELSGDQIRMISYQWKHG